MEMTTSLTIQIFVLHYFFAVNVLLVRDLLNFAVNLLFAVAAGLDLDEVGLLVLLLAALAPCRRWLLLHSTANVMMMMMTMVVVIMAVVVILMLFIQNKSFSSTSPQRRSRNVLSTVRGILAGL